MLVLKNIIFTLLVPGTVAVYLPLYFADRSGRLLWLPLNTLKIAALIPMVTGAAVYFWCLWNFMIKGKGTPLPIDAPKRLVVHGLYRYMRNPMYVGVLLVIAAWAILFWSANLAVYGAVVWAFFHLFVVAIEEPLLKSKFGPEYEDYCKKVGRWLPKSGMPSIPRIFI